MVISAIELHRSIYATALTSQASVDNTSYVSHHAGKSLLKKTEIRFLVCSLRKWNFRSQLWKIHIFEQYFLLWLNVICWVFRLSARADMICPFWGHLILSSCSTAPCLLPTFWSSWEMPAYLMENKSFYSSSYSHPYSRDGV